MDVLVVGAGPVGLTAAIELQRLGINVRIIEKRVDASGLSRAVGILPRSMELLEASGVTAKLLDEAIVVKRANFFSSDRQLLQFDIGNGEKYGHIYALPQDQSESLMRLVFEGGGGKVEFAKELTGFTDSGNAIEAEFSGEKAQFDYLVAADGVGSFARHALDIAYPGLTVDNLWSIADFESKAWPYQEEIAVWLKDDGAVYFTIPIGKARFRMISNREHSDESIPIDVVIDKFNRAGNFAVQVRQATTYQKGRVFLVGDAAHCHSPIGGRGMNLGIEDACNLARRIANGDTAGYSQERHKVGKAVIKFTERGRKFISEGNPQFRNWVFGAIGHLPQSTINKIFNRQLLNR